MRCSVCSRCWWWRWTHAEDVLVRAQRNRLLPRVNACSVVLDATEQVVDRARGCAVAALGEKAPTGSGGTDTTCGNAVYAVQAVADGLTQMLGGCLAGGDSSTATCRLVTETATFVVDNLEAASALCGCRRTRCRRRCRSATR